MPRGPYHNPRRPLNYQTRDSPHLQCGCLLEPQVFTSFYYSRNITLGFFIYSFTVFTFRCIPNPTLCNKDIVVLSVCPSSEASDMPAFHLR